MCIQAAGVQQARRSAPILVKRTSAHHRLQDGKPLLKLWGSRPRAIQQGLVVFAAIETLLLASPLQAVHESLGCAARVGLNRWGGFGRDRDPSESIVIAMI